MTKCEVEILRNVTRGEAYWGTFSYTAGRRMRDAAESLQNAKLVRLVDLGNPHDSERRYVAIAPNAEWDFEARSVRHNAGVKRRRSRPLE